MRVGSITLVLGPMYSGKSSELHRVMRRNFSRVVLCVCSKRDDRYDEGANHSVTHNNLLYPCFSCNALSEVDVKGVDIIGVDEGHFFPDLCETVSAWALLGKDVVVACLHANYLQKPFAQVSELIARCSEITWLIAVCTVCGKDAPHSYRISDSNEEILVGGKSEYMALCSTCYVSMHSK